MIPIKDDKENYEFINLTLWWFKIPEVVSTIVAIAGIALYFLGQGDGAFFCGFYTRIVMIPFRLYFVNWKRRLERNHPSLKRQKFSGQDAYKTLELSYLRFEKWAADGLDRAFGFFRK